MQESFGRSAFLISKPLQLMIALCVVRQWRWHVRPTFVLVEDFSGARAVAERLAGIFQAEQVPVFFNTRNEALAYLRCEPFQTLFVDSDVGVRNFLELSRHKLAHPRRQIHVYEEGVGTYRTDLYPAARSRLFQLAGVATHFGGCRFVSTVNVFDVDHYVSRIPQLADKVRPIRGSLSGLLQKERSAFQKLFDYEPVARPGDPRQTCTLYLSSWKLDERFIDAFAGLSGDHFVKLHPRITSAWTNETTAVIGEGAPAELVIMDLLDAYSQVRIFDHNSSVRRYIASDRLKFVSAEMPPEFVNVTDG